MKKIIYLLILCMVTFFSCKEMDDNFKEYVIPDGITYPQKADSLKVFSGLNKVRLQWYGAKDPKVVKAKIFWNNYTDSLAVNIPANKDTVSYLIGNLEENTYTFYVKTYDDDGNVSVPSEATGRVYGDKYISTLAARSVLSTAFSGTDGIVTLAAATPDNIFTEIRYTNNAGVKQIIRVLPDETLVICPDAKRKEPVEHRSAFWPENSIDTFYRDWSIATPFLFKLDKTEWIADADSYLVWSAGNGSTGNGGLPQRTIDNDLASAWHSSTGGSMPRWVRIDMKQPQTIYSLGLYLHPQFQYAINVRVFVSDRPEQETWELITEFRFPAGISTTVEFPTEKTAQYLIIYFIDTSSYVYSNLAEVDVFGS